MSADASADLTGLTKRSYTLEAVFTGADGRQNSKTWVFSCSPRTDYTAPETISNLRSSYFGTATISLTASDIGGDGVAYTAYKVDNSAWTTRTTNPTVITVYPPASGSPVAHKISYWSIDMAGNQETTITKDFTVGAEDTTPPVTTSNATAYYKAPGTILLFASDANGSGVNQTYFRFSNDPTATAGTMIGTGGAGEHTLWFWSVDNVGHVEPTNTVTFIVDELAPTTTSNAARYYEGVAKIDLSAQDLSDGPGVKTSGIKQTFYTVDDGAQNTGTTIEIQPPASGSVVHHIDFWSEDRAGNSEQPTRAEFSVQAPTDKTPPVTNCDFKKTYAVPGLIKLSASDAGWGVASTAYKLDSGDWTEGLTVRTGGPLPAGQVHTLLPVHGQGRQPGGVPDRDLHGHRAGRPAAGHQL